MRLEFYGAAGGVTGSHFVLDDGNLRLGIDAGLFQGREAELNQKGFGHDQRSLNLLLLTHAHIDHSGRVPLLVKQGFRGPVYSTSATVDLCEIMLKDSAHLMKEEADRSNRHPERGLPRQPLYTESNVIQAIRRFRSVEYNKTMRIDGVSISFRDAGHILGSAMLELAFDGGKIVFSGDLGRPDTPILCDPWQVEEADWLVLESTYGDRYHGDIADRGKRLLEIVLETTERGGNVVIPAFAVGRTQEILFELNPYAETGRLRGINCFVDSPLAIAAGQIYRRHPECFDAQTLEMLEKGDDPQEFPGIQYTRAAEDSKAINALKDPHIIISANGMCTGGRILHHLAHNLERPNSTMLFVGFQAEGTLGRMLQNGAKKVSIMGKEFDVKARIEALDSFSAHADRGEILKWLKGFKKFPHQVFVCHGEPLATQSLAQAIRDEFETEVSIPVARQVYRLS
ncbi:MAG: MBL fold metallo-hydrolase [Methanotrichaceae archaeon]|nr:MBL fold metallo-hydrolase [Methanotrichaceae archaeon]